MDDPSPAELVLVVGSIEVLARFTKKSQGVWTNVGEPSRGVSRPRVTGHTLNNSQRACCFGVGFREHLGCCRHWLLLPGRPCLRGPAIQSNTLAHTSDLPTHVAKYRPRDGPASYRSEEHTSELQSLMRISYAVFCLRNKNNPN